MWAEKIKNNLTIGVKRKNRFKINWNTFINELL